MLRIAGLLALCLLAPGPQEMSTIGDASKLKILYAGCTGDEREKQFLDLLNKYFLKVDSISLKDLSSAAARDYDVVIADWSRRYSGKGGFDGSKGHGVQLGNFSKPIVMIGAVGGELQSHTKLDWL